MDQLQTPGKPVYSELEAIWLQRLHRAWERYTEASHRLDQILEQYDLAHEGLNPDGALDIRRARESESQALAEYSRVLKIFTDLVVYRIMPGVTP